MTSVAMRRIGTTVPIRRVVLSVEGMTCVACAVRVEKTLHELGDVAASVNFLTGTASIDAPEDRSVADLCRAVELSGYRAVGVDPRTVPSSRDRKPDRLRLAVSALLTGALLWLSTGTSPAGSGSLMVVLAIALVAPIVTWAAYPVHTAAVRQIRSGTPTMDVLLSASICVATAWPLVVPAIRSAIGLGTGWSSSVSDTVFLYTAAGVTTVVLAGRYLRAAAQLRAGSALSELAERGSRMVTVVAESGRRMRVPSADLREGQRFVVRPGEAFAVDGLVVEGGSMLDESTLTGRSTPVPVQPGAAVAAGTVVRDGWLLIEAAANNGVSAMLRAAQRAQHGRGRWQYLVDRISARFVVAVLSLAVLTTVAWLIAGAPVDRSFGVGLAVMVVACPCALGLATPTALHVAAGRGAHEGIFLDGHAALERSHSIDVVVFDKTGTLTEGDPVVDRITLGEGVSQTDLLRRGGAVADISTHPFAAAITAAAQTECGALPQVIGFTEVGGHGAGGVVEGRQVRIGQLKYMLAQGVRVPEELRMACRRGEFDGLTSVLVAIDDRAAGVLAISDRVRDGSAAAIDALHRRGLHTVLLTGDNRYAARAVADQVGIDEVIAEVPPEGKVEEIRRLQDLGHRVAMVGDGVNDGPALAAADLGVAVGAGVDVAVEAADIVLVGNDLRSISRAFDLAAHTLSIIRENLLWAAGYNIVAIPVAMSGILSPLIASGAMAVSSCLVVWNSSRLREDNAAWSHPRNLLRRNTHH